MTTLSFLLLWFSFSVIVGLVVLLYSNPVLIRATGDQENICLSCGRVISGDEPAICSVCAEFATEVSFPVLVRQVVPEYTVINAGDLGD
jgi:hypothetical protein